MRIKDLSEFLDSKKGMCLIVAFILLIHFFLVLSSAWNLSAPVDFDKNLGVGYDYFTKGVVNPTPTTSQGHIFGLAPLLANVDMKEGFFLSNLRAGNNKGTLAFYGVLDNNEMNEEYYEEVEGVTSDQNLRKVLRFSYIIESLLSVLTALIVYMWARQAFGKTSGYIAVLLYSFSPYMSSIVHGLHSDNIARFFVVLTFFLLWRFINSTNFRNLALMAISLGFTMSVKISTAFYPFLILIIFVIALLINDRFKENMKSLFKIKWSNQYVNSISAFLLILLIAVLVINGLYLFKDIFKPIADYDYGEYAISSKFFLSVKESFLGKIPLPISPYYVLGIDIGKFWSEGNDYLFFLGNLYQTSAPKSFYFISFLVKTTLPVLILFLITHLILTLVNLSSKNEKIKIIRFNLIFLFFIMYSIFIFTIVATNMVAGLRHLSMVYPLMFVAISSVLAVKFPFSKFVKYFIGILVVWHIIIYLLAFPFYVSYSNELIGRNNGYLYFRDTNIEYHELYYHAIKYKEEHPEVRLFPECLVEQGKVTMSPNDLNFQRAGCYGWLKNFEPVDFIGNSWPVYQIDGRWVQNEDGQIQFIPSPNMKLRKDDINPFFKWLVK